MDEFEITFSRTYKIVAGHNEEAIERAIEDFGLDLEFGCVSVCRDDFSIKATKVNK